MIDLSVYENHQQPVSSSKIILDIHFARLTFHHQGISATYDNTRAYFTPGY